MCDEYNRLRLHQPQTIGLIAFHLKLKNTRGGQNFQSIIAVVSSTRSILILFFVFFFIIITVNAINKVLK